jgi:aminopeptidase YwaD
MTDDTRRLRRDLDAICACGGRLCGEDSERAAVALLARLGAEATGVPARIEPVVYDGWRALDVSLTGSDGRTYPAHPLVRSAPTPPEGLEAEVIDLGRGTPEEFDAHRDEIAGRIVLVRHELMFAPGTIHRRFKIAQAIAAGAAGFLIAGPAPGHVVAGSARSPGEPGLPALGISPETAAMFARTAAGRPRARMRIATEEAPAQADNLLFDLPAGDGDRIVLSAHIDGHALGESAIDNASGLAVALEAARRVLPDRASWRRGLTLAFFNVEEWALTGSEQHVAAMTGAERERVALNVNLDSVAGGGTLTALTSGFRGLEPFLLESAERAGVPLGLFRPLQRNSDHANFARAGIPAFRLVAGFGEPTAAARLVLTPLDQRSVIDEAELERRAVGAGSAYRPEDGGQDHAGERHSAAATPPARAPHHRQPAFSGHRAQPAEAKLPRRRA